MEYFLKKQKKTKQNKQKKISNIRPPILSQALELLQNQSLELHYTKEFSSLTLAQIQYTYTSPTPCGGSVPGKNNPPPRKYPKSYRNMHSSQQQAIITLVIKHKYGRVDGYSALMLMIQYQHQLLKAP